MTDTNETKPQESEGSDRFADFIYDYYPDKLATVNSNTQNEWHFRSLNGLVLRVNLISDQLFRVRYALGNLFEREFSYALNPDFSFEEPSLKAIEETEFYEIKTSKISILVSKHDLSLKVLDLKGLALLEQSTPFYLRTTINKGVDQVRLDFKLKENDSFWGLGDKTCKLNLRGEKLENWNTDSFAYGEKTDPLYRSIPFFYGLRQQQGFGIFLHNTYRTHFDFGNEKADQFSFWADGGEMDFFFIYGPQLDTVSSIYHQLTGLPELPPMWALGFHQCRWSYYPESTVRALAEEFRERQIPCDAIYLDIDYMDGYRCFTWNKDYFPDPKEMIADLQDQGFQTVVMIDPGIRNDPNYHVFQSGMAKNVFCRRTSGELMIGPVWPPACVFPDFTRPDVRDWWGQLYRELYKNQEVSGFWNDMNEPAVFKVKSKTFPDQVLHDNEGQLTDHKQIHNIYGQQMTRASYEGFKDIRPEKRPFLLTRATFSGGQRYASVWTGDNVASWEHLHLASTQCQRLSISGFSFCGTDIGGFDKQPDGELFVRWLQLGVFHLLYRVHSMGNNFDGAAETDADVVKQAELENRQNQEPWSFGEPFTAWARSAINLRYQLLPLHYTAFWKHIQTGESIIKSLIFYDQTDEEVKTQWDGQFIFNDQLLVCPVNAPQIDKMDCYLPRGKWLDYWDGTVYQGKEQHQIPILADRLPIFVKAGSIVPNYPIQQYTGEGKFDRIALRVYPGATGESFLYEDEGEGYGYRNGRFSLRKFILDQLPDRIVIRQNKSGQMPNTYQEFEMNIFGLSKNNANFKADGKKLKSQISKGIVHLIVPANFFEFEISFGQ